MQIYTVEAMHAEVCPLPLRETVQPKPPSVLREHQSPKQPSVIGHFETFDNTPSIVDNHRARFRYR